MSLAFISEKRLSKVSITLLALIPDIILSLLISIWLFTMYRCILIPHSVITGGDEVYYIHLLPNNVFCKFTSYSPWYGGPMTLYLSMWINLVLLCPLSWIFHTNFVFVFVLLITCLSAICFRRILDFLLVRYIMYYSVESNSHSFIFLRIVVTSVEIIAAFIFVAVGGVCLYSINPFIVGPGESMGFTFIIIPIWIYLAFKVINITKGKKILLAVLSILSLMFLYNTGGFVIMIVLYVLYILSLIINYSPLSQGNKVNKKDLLTVLISFFLVLSYSIAPALISHLLSAGGAFSYYFNPSALKIRLSCINTLSELLLFKLPGYFIIKDTYLFEIIKKPIYLFSVGAFTLPLFLMGIFDLVSKVKIFLYKKLHVLLTFIIFMLLLLVVSIFLNEAPLFETMKLLYIYLFYIAGGVLSEPCKFGGLFSYCYFTFMAIGLISLFLRLYIKLSNSNTRFKILLVILTIALFAFIIYALYSVLDILYKIYIPGFTCKLYSPLKIPEGLYSVGNIVSCKYRMIIFPTDFEWLWKPSEKKYGWLTRYPYAFCTLGPFKPFRWYDWRNIGTVLCSCKDILRSLIYVFIRHYGYAYFLFQKDLYNFCEKYPSFSLYNCLMLNMIKILRREKVCNLLVNDSTELLFTCKAQFITPVKLSYDIENIVKKLSSLSNVTVACLKKHYINAKYNNILVLILSLRYFNTDIISKRYYKYLEKYCKKIIIKDISVIYKESWGLSFVSINIHIGNTTPNNSCIALLIGEPYSHEYIITTNGASKVIFIPDIVNYAVLVIKPKNGAKHIEVSLINIATLVWILISISIIIFIIILIVLDIVKLLSHRNSLKEKPSYLVRSPSI